VARVLPHDKTWKAATSMTIVGSPPSTRVRAAVVGTGFAGSAHVDAVSRLRDVELVGVLASTQERSQAAAERFRVSRAYASLAEVLDDVDVIHNCTPNVDRRNVAVNGNLDTKHYDNVLERAWTFRTVGYGQGERTWRDFVSALRAVDYDSVLSIEHEDQLMSMDEGLRKAIELLQTVVIREEKPKMWWA
jgi:hypothetical protein